MQNNKRHNDKCEGLTVHRGGEYSGSPWADIENVSDVKDVGVGTQVMIARNLRWASLPNTEGMSDIEANASDLQLIVTEILIKSPIRDMKGMCSRGDPCERGEDHQS